MSTKAANTDPTQVDFYLLNNASVKTVAYACQLAMMLWERKHKIYIAVATESSIRQMDEQMWQQPDERFLPHSTSDDPNASKAAVVIGTLSGLNPTDAVINLCPDAVPHPERFNRILEIVPFTEHERQACRVKYKIYRDLGLIPQTNEINK